MADAAQLALWLLITGGTPLLLAGVPLLRSRVSDGTTHLMLGFSAGLLGGLATINLLPESFAVANDPRTVALGFAVGFFLLLLVERHVMTSPGHGVAHYEDGRSIQPFGSMAIGALAIHGLIDGFVIPLGFAVDPALGTIILIAVAVHQIPDGFAALAVGLASGGDRKRVLRFVLATAIDTPIGILLGLLFLGSVGTAWLGAALAFSAGTFLFVSAADLIPELQHRTRSGLVTASILLGFAAVAALSFLPG